MFNGKILDERLYFMLSGYLCPVPGRIYFLYEWREDQQVCKLSLICSDPSTARRSQGFSAHIENMAPQVTQNQQECGSAIHIRANNYRRISVISTDSLQKRLRTLKLRIWLQNPLWVFLKSRAGPTVPWAGIGHQRAVYCSSTYGGQLGPCGTFLDSRLSLHLKCYATGRKAACH